MCFSQSSMWLVLSYHSSLCPNSTSSKRPTLTTLDKAAPGYSLSIILFCFLHHAHGFLRDQINFCQFANLSSPLTEVQLQKDRTSVLLPTISQHVAQFLAHGQSCRSGLCLFLQLCVYTPVNTFLPLGLCLCLDSSPLHNWTIFIL